ncbi:MAG: DUF3108 domain-containing protein [Candidatus Poribacteria bacterium]|nr:DUF3108 domain-containing protein [Candidatus Poribacteria bacterium]
MRRTLILLPMLVCVTVLCAAETWGLPERESLHYSVKWGRWTVVEATYDYTRPSPNEVTLDALAWTTKLPSRIYRVENRFISTIDPKSGFPTRYEKRCDEAKFQEYSTVTYRQRERRADYSLEGERGWSQTLVEPTHTIFTAYTAWRLHDFGATPTLVFVLDAKGAYWRATAERRRNLRTDEGIVWEVNVTFDLIEGDPNKRQSDLLTDNLVSGDKPLLLHVKSRNIATGTPPQIVQMEYEARGFHLVATLDRIETGKNTR